MTRDPKRNVRPALATGGVALAAFLAASVVLPRLPLRDGRVPAVQRYPDFEDPGADYFYAATERTELSQSVLYHDLGRSIANARRADVLFLGNSRMPLGLREEFLVPRAERLGVRLFSLACGHSETLRFPLELIRRHDLRPRVVVVNGGPHMFHEGTSRVAAEAMAMGRFEAVKQRIEVAGAWALRTRLHALVPRLDFFGRRLHSRWITYRSARTGWWRPVAEPGGSYETSSRGTSRDWGNLLPFTHELHDELRARGVLLVLTLVPYPDAALGHLRFLSEALSVPAIVPSFEGVTTADGSHLNRASAELVSTDFWERFVALPRVREALGLDPR